MDIGHRRTGRRQQSSRQYQATRHTRDVHIGRGAHGATEGLASLHFLRVLSLMEMLTMAERKFTSDSGLQPCS